MIVQTQDLTANVAAELEAGGTLYKQLARRITELIKHGTLRPGDRVPSVRKCSEQQGVSIATVTQAYRLLESRGVIEARPQSGYYVKFQRWSSPPEPETTWPPLRPAKVQLSDLVMEVVRVGRDPSLTRLGAALPSPELFPLQALNRTMAAVGRRSPSAAHSYDAPPGNRALRVQVARRAMEAGCTLSPDDIVTTNGATEALNLCLRAVTRPGDVVAIESPTFFGILHIIESLGLRVCEIPTSPRDGIELQPLADRLQCCRIKACVFSPNFSNPLGSLMPDEKKKELVAMLTRGEIPLIEDDIYGSLSFEQVRPKTAKAFDARGWVMLCDSFTKTLSPGYRVGWVAAGRFRSRVEFLKYVNTSATASLPQMAIADFLQNGGYDHHLRKVRRLYAEQTRRVSEAVQQHFPPGTRATRPAGGVCLWVELPGQIDGLELYRQALRARISIAPGPIFSPKQQYRNFIRLNCGNPWTSDLEAAIARLGRLANGLLSKAVNSAKP